MPGVYRARVTSKGQVTVPQAVRQALGVATGDDLAFEVGPDGVTVRPVRAGRSFADLQGRWRRGQGATPAQIDAWLREQRGREDTL